jgi:hypothetical protein
MPGEAAAEVPLHDNGDAHTHLHVPSSEPVPVERAQPWLPTERQVVPRRLAPSPELGAEHDNRKRMLGVLRSLRAEAQNLQQSLDTVKQKSELADETVRAHEVRTALLSNEPIFKYNRTKIRALLSELDHLRDQDAELYDWAGDELTHIANYWERASRLWPDVSTSEAQIGAQIGRASEQLDELVFHCALLTIPNRVNQHLSYLSVGQTCDFHETFSDELPKIEQRLKMLNFMYAHPSSVNGVVDVERGLIYRAAPKMSRRVGSALMILGVAALCGVLAYWLRDVALWLGVAEGDIPATGHRELLAGYLVVLLGGFVHIGVDAIKQVRQAQQKRGPTFLAISNWLMWAHVQELYIIVGIVWLFIGFVGSMVVLKRVEFFTAFLVGYSVDSFVDLFLQRFTRFSSTGTDALKASLG